jgi:peptidyl-prolyl cis-trans isomerase B (cyclophilin B)
MASKKKQQNLFSGAEGKLAAYEAKQRIADTQASQRKKDNRVAVIAGVAAFALAAAAQVGYTVTHPAPSATDAAVTAAPSEEPSNSADVPAASIAENRVWKGSMKVNENQLGIELFGDKAPQAAANFIALSNKGFYEGLTCHRLTTAGLYVLQCGDPKGDGTGGPGYSFGPIENAPAADSSGVGTYKMGVIAMANSGSPYSNGSQFFIVYQDSKLPANYTVFGRVTSNLSSLASVIESGVAGGGTDGKPAVATTISSITLK